MRKRIVSLLLSLALCLTLLPTAAFAEKAQLEELLPGEQLEQVQSVPEEPEETEEQSQQDEDVIAVQAMIDALPDAAALDGMDDENAMAVYEAFQAACDAYYETLNEEQQAQLKNTEKLEALSKWFSQSAALAVGTHEHYLCGGTDCNGEGHGQEDKKTTFEPWTGSATTTGGAYYLTRDISGFTVPSGVDLTLCLNGYNITSDGVQNEDVITIEPGATFTLCDCKRGGTTDYGTIGHRRPDQYNGSGVTVENGTFNMYGGKIANNTVGYFTTHKSNGYGGGVLVFNKGIFNMIGGEITGNRAKYGGGVSVGTAYGLHDNTAEDIGGTFNMTGGEISGNFCTSKGGGVYACVSSKLYFTVSGSAQITDNYTGDLFSSSPAEGTANNVYLEKYTNDTTGETIMATIKVGTLDSTASIGVTTEEVGQTVATGVSEAAAKCFTSDDSKYRLIYDSGAGTLTMATAGHSEHPICGDVNCTNNDHALSEGKSWVGVSDLSKITAAGYYYLTADVEITSIWQPRNGVVLCLNGYDITMDGVGYAIYVREGYTFTLCDCFGGGKITHTKGVIGRGVYVVGTFNMYGGSISGNSAQWGGGVCLDNGGKGTVFNMYGGEITGNTATSSGGGGVNVNTKSTFNMYGGSITDNLNTASGDYGGGVYVSQDGIFTVSGKVNITGNEYKDNTVSNVYLYSGKAITVDGKLDSSASIGVTTKNAVDLGKSVTVATGAAGSCTEGNFFADKGGELGIKVEPGTDADSVNVNLYNGRPHVHPICGAEHEDINGHTGACGDVNWTPWDGVSDITYDSDTKTAYVYLTDNAARDSALTVADGYKLYLCLNGHSLTRTTSGPVITVGNIEKRGSGATLSLCDCKGGGEITHRVSTSKKTGTGVSLGHKSTFDMYGGSITDNRNGTGGGVSMSSNSEYGNNKFNMYGGSITNNVADNGYGDGGGGVHNLFGTFTMYGGSITKNNANEARNGGGGVYLARWGTFIMKGGSITDNTAKNGGGVYVNSTGLTVSGDVKITGNTDKDGEANNVYLMSGNTIRIGGALTGGPASIGVTTASTIANEDYLAIARGGSKYTLKEGDLDAFTSDNTAYGKQLLSNSVVFTNGALHIHAVCGTKDCKDSGHGNELWQPISDESGLRNATAGGHYYLTNNIQLYTNAWTPKNGVVLCLNGKSITANGSFDAITVPKGVTFTLTDCNTSTPGKITHAQGGKGCGVQVNGKFNMYGGSISGNTTNGSGGGVCVSEGTFTMENGTIGGNTAYGRGGGGVYVYNGTFKMKNGTISGNSADNSKGGSGYGGGVYADGFCTFTMSGNAAISGNTAAGSYGGGVYMDDFNGQSIFTMSGNAAISGNTAKSYGGGVCVKYGTFTMNGGTISGNAATGINGDGGGVYVASTDDTPSKFIMNSGTISGNTASDYGGGVYVYSTIVSGGIFTMNGGTISGNNSTYGGGGVYVGQNANMTVSGGARIADNWKNGSLNSDGGAYVQGDKGSANNLYLCSGATVTIGGLTQAARIGITTGKKPTAEAPVPFATGATDTALDYAKIFTPDAMDQGYVVNNEGGTLFLTAHRHSWTYELDTDGRTITAKCDADGCANRDGGSVTISASDAAYDRSAKTATVTASGDWKGDAADSIAVKYTGRNGTAYDSTSAPTNAGKYTASIKLGNATASVEYEITKVAPKIASWSLYTGPLPAYNGEQVKNPTSLPMTFGEFADITGFKWYQATKNEDNSYTKGEELSAPPTDAGDYYIEAIFKEGTNTTAGIEGTGLTVKPMQTEKVVNAKEYPVYANRAYTYEIDLNSYLTDLHLGTGVTYTKTNGDLPDYFKAGELSISSDGKLTVPVKETTTAPLPSTIATIVVWVKSSNYGRITLSVPIQMVAKKSENLAVSMTGWTYGESANKPGYTVPEGVTATVTYAAQGSSDFSTTVPTNAGNYTVKVQYETAIEIHTGTAEFTISKREIAVPTADPTQFEYTGQEQTYVLSNFADASYYTVSNTMKRTDAGSQNVTVQLKDKNNTVWEDGTDKDKTYVFTIAQKPLSKVTIGDFSDQTYTGLPIQPAVAPVDGNKALTEGTDYTVSYGANTNVGKATITVTGTGNYTGTVSKEWNITPAVLTISGVTVVDKTYNGSADATVTAVAFNGLKNGEVLVIGTDYEVHGAAFNDENVDTANKVTGTVALKNTEKAKNYTLSSATFEQAAAIGRADYTGTASTTVNIVKGRSTAQTGTLTAADFFPEGQMPAGAAIVSVTPNSGTIIESIAVDGTNHKLDYVSKTNIAAAAEESYTVTIAATNYKDITATLTFHPTNKLVQDGFKFENGSVTRTYGDEDFTLTASGEVKGSTVTYESSEPAVATVDGTGKVTIKGAGTTVITAKAAATDEYDEAVATCTLTVEKKLIAIPAADATVFTYNGKPQTYALVENQAYTVSGNVQTDANETGYSVKAALKDTANTQWKDGTDEDKTYVFTIAPKPLSKVTIGDFPDKTYTGLSIQPVVAPVDGNTALTENTDYTVSYGANTNVGKATITVTGTGNYTGTVSKEWKITPAVLTISGVTVADKTYNGSADATVTAVAFNGLKNGEELVIGTDYEVNGAAFNDENVDAANKVTGTVALKNTEKTKNYTLYSATFEQAAAIGRADYNGTASTTVNIVKGRSTAQTGTLTAADFFPEGQMPAGAAIVSVTPNSGTIIESIAVDGTNHKLDYVSKTNIAAAADESYTVTIATTNYKDITATLTFHPTDKLVQDGFKFENGSVTKTYGDEDFTLTTIGEVKGSTVTYESSEPAVAAVDSATGKVTIKGAGTAVITAKAAATDEYDEAVATCTLTVEKKLIAIPAADATVFTYNGKPQTYALVENQAYTVSGNVQTDANETGYSVKAALKDTANTQWKDGMTADKTYTFVIGKAVITVTAKDQTAYVGDKAPELGEDSYTVSGLVGEEKLTTQPTVKYVDADGNEIAPDMTKTGEVKILADGAVASGNYTIRYKDGKLTVSTRPSSGGGSSRPSTHPVQTEVRKDPDGSVSLSKTSAAKGDKVTITVKPNRHYKVDEVIVRDSKGKQLAVKDNGDGTYTFEMPADKVTVEPTFTWVNPFADVANNAYYVDAVEWMLKREVTQGTTETTFSPNLNCTRAQIVTFLWRAAGSPEPKGTVSFADVPAGSYYAKAVAWAIENGITGGTGNGKFSPNATCTREQAVAFLYRASGSPAVSGGSAFSDVAASAYYADAVAWAEQNGVTGGIGNGEFGTGSDCTRAQIVTFLYRAYQGK